MFRRNYLLFFVLVGLSILIFDSCFNQIIRTDSDTFLEFSKDTLAFDTVFTSLGSATRRMKVYNPYNDAVVIEKVMLENLADDFFRLNIDGLAANVHENVEIAGGDSIYIFAEVTVDPDMPLSDSPFVVEDFIRFTINGNNQSVLLSAWGQNANYIPNSNNRGGQALLTCDFGQVVFDDPKPYVIYGVLLIDSCELVIPAGTDVYVHGGVVNTDNGAYNDGIIVVLENGRITVNGTVDEPVVIQGDRLEQEYDDLPGQWAGIIVNDLSRNSVFKNTIVKNSIFGVRVDSLAEARFEQCQFYNQISSGIVGFHADEIYAENCLFYNAGGATVTLAYGGKFTLNYCTMASFDSGGSALAVSNFRCLEPTCLQGLLFNPVNLIMNNCVMIGDGQDEVIFNDRSEEDDFEYQLDHCIVQVDELLEVVDFANFFENCSNCLNVTVQDTVFNDVQAFDFRLDTMSVALDRAIPIMGVDVDIIGRSRDSVMPDPGCYEFE